MTLLLLLFLGFTFLLAYPFTIYPLILACLPRTPSPEPPRQARDALPSAALLFCARNEAAVLPATLERLRQVHRANPDLRMLVWDDGSDDATPGLLARESAWLEVRQSARPLGKVRGLERLIAGLDCDILLLMDANSLPDPAGIKRLRARFRDPAIGAVGATLLPVAGKAGPAGRVAGIYWRLEERIKALESRTGSTIGCDGALWAIRRSLYPKLDPAECDDFRASLAPLIRGYRTVSAPDVLVEERIDDAAAGWTRMQRIACGAWHADRSCARELARLGPLDRFKYLSHKRLRWFSGLWLLGAAASGAALAHGAGLGLLAGPLALGIALGMAFRVGPLAGLRAMCLGMLAVSWGVVLAMAGRSIATWHPAREA